MTNWFTVENIDSSTFAISEYRHWEQTHSYLVVGTDIALLIDTGMGISNIKTIVEKLTDLPVLALVTHAHWDHIGGLSLFKQIGVHKLEKEWLTTQFPLKLSEVKKNLMRDPNTIFPAKFDIDSYKVYQGQVQSILRGNEIIDLGERKIKVLHTPGHSPGHCCFYDLKRQYLFTGDLIYSGTLDAFYPSTDPKKFSESVEKMNQLIVRKILPGHYSLNLPPDFIQKVNSAFVELELAGKLVQGNGCFDFDGFRIHV